jgi:hypothetical protein
VQESQRELLRHKIESGSIVVLASDLITAPIPKETLVSINHSLRALAAVALAATIAETERNEGTFVLRTGDEPPDHVLEERDARRRLREREQVRRDAEYEKNAAIIRAERLKRKAENRVKRQPYGKGHVVINGIKCPAQQMPPDGNFRKRTTRYFYKGQWSEWCKDDHDIFVADA